MEVEFRNDTNNREYIDKERVNKKVKEILYSLRDFYNSASSVVKDEWIPTIKEWASYVNEVLSTKMVEEEIEFLTFDKLVEIVRTHKVVSSDSCAVFKTMLKDGRFQFVITFLHDGKILPAEDNCDIVIDCEGISRDLKEKFNDSQFIVLK